MNQETKVNIKDIYETLIHKRFRTFFDAKGLTISEANYKANLIKEVAESIEAQFKNTSAYTSEMIFDGRNLALDSFISIELKDLANQEGNLYGLSAWLREAIKAKALLLTQVATMDSLSLLMPDETLIESFTERQPNRIQPLRQLFVTEEDVLGAFSIGERAEYYAVEAKAAHLGKKIHPNGVISRIRKDLQTERKVTFKQLPDGVGQKTYVVEHIPLYNPESVDDLFFELQSQHRSYEEKLNYFKARIKNEVTDANAKSQEVFTKAVRAAHDAYELLIQEWQKDFVKAQTAQREQISLLEERRLQLTKHVAALKVVIPKEFEVVLETIDEKK
jgi:vacuolar-type H+-ATPase subunit H